MIGFFKRAALRTAGGALSPASPTADTNDYRTALDHQIAGRFGEAAQLYLGILERQPDHFDTLHMLGVLRFQTGDSATAIELLKKAVTIAPANPHAHANLGATLRSAHRFDEAERSLREAARLDPGWGDAHVNLGSLLLARGDPTGAEAAFRDGLACDEENVDAAFGLGVALGSLGKTDEAEHLLRKVVALRPNAPEPHFHLGNLQAGSGQSKAAIDSYRRALELNPTLAEAQNNLGNLLQAQGDCRRAEGCYRAALRADPNFVSAHHNLGVVLRVGDRLDEAENCCRRALELSPDRADIYCNLAAICKSRGQLDQALAAVSTALALEPSLSAAHSTHGAICGAQGELTLAEASFRRAVALDPRNTSAKYNLATVRLLRGDYREGFALYEFRFDCFRAEMLESRGLHELLDPSTCWDGEALGGRRVLLWAEQGLGDSLMMMRYLPLLRGVGAGRVVVQCQPTLERVMRSMPGVDQVICHPDPLPATEFDVHAPLMSLPFLLGTERDNIPGAIGYLAVPREMKAAWRLRLASRAGLKVGLAWAGSPALRDDARRSIPLRKFDALSRMEGVRVLSLQKDGEAGQLMDSGARIESWMDQCVDFMDTAALVEELDLVISVDTAVVHLAGALGKPCWLLNRYGSEWRWGTSGDRSPWYRSVTVYRQEQGSAWDDVIARVIGDLGKLVSRRAR